MEKLFDEVFQHETGDSSRTIWYGYMTTTMDDEVMNRVATIIRNDLNSAEQAATVTHWVFYSGEATGDALGENVRASLMVRERETQFVVHCNLSDFGFVTIFDRVVAFKDRLEKHLNTSK